MNVDEVTETESEVHLLEDALDFLCEEIRDEHSDVVMKVNKIHRFTSPCIMFR